MPVSSRSTISTFHRMRSAYRWYMRKSSAANSAASSPPVPPRISRKTLRESFGSFGRSNTFSSCSIAARRSVSAARSAAAIW